MNISEENIFDQNITWIYIGKKRIGLYDFFRLPKNIVDIILNKENDVVNVILFKEKKDKADFIQNFEEVNKLPPKLLDVAGKDTSRFTLLKTFGLDERSYVLLNMSSISENSVSYLINVNSNMLNKRTEPDKFYSKVIKSIVKSLFIYKDKIGLPFLVFDNIKEDLLYSINLNLITNYYEVIALFECTNDSNIYEFSDYINYKINILFEQIKKQKIKNIFDVFYVMNNYISIVTFLNCAYQYKDVYKEVFHNIKLQNEALLEKNDYIHLKKMCNLIINKKIKNINNLTDYIDNISKLILKSIKLVPPKYEFYSEIPKIFKIATLFAEEIRDGIFSYQPRIGNFEDFLSTINNIIKNEEVYLALRIICLQCYVFILSNYLLNYFDYKKYVDYKEKCFILTDLIKKLHKENIDETDYHKLILSDPQDIILNLMSLATFAALYSDDELVDKCKNEAYKIALEEGLNAHLIIILWKLYLSSHNSEYLVKIYQIFNENIVNKYPESRGLINCIGYIVKSFFEPNNFQNIENSFKWLEELLNDNNIGTNQDFHLYVLYNDVISILRELMKSETDNKYDNLQTIKKHILSIEYEAPNNDPLILIALKSRILLSLIEENYVDLKNNINKIKNNLNYNDQMNEFIYLIESWITFSETEDRRFLYKIQYSINYDPWIRNAIKIISDKSNIDLDRNPISANGIVITEGPIDEVVLDTFFKKIHPEKKMLFINANGFQNLILLYKRMDILKEQNIPIYTLFDGDTLIDKDKRKQREDLELKYDIKKENSFTLKLHSIESYLINMDIIHKLLNLTLLEYETIKKDLTKYENKKDKKQILKHILREKGLKYNTEKAKEISELFNEKIIDEEIKNIFKKITKNKQITD